jgi:hypothetical protein
MVRQSIHFHQNLWVRVRWVDRGQEDTVSTVHPLLQEFMAHQVLWGGWMEDKRMWLVQSIFLCQNLWLVRSFGAHIKIPHWYMRCGVHWLITSYPTDTGVSIVMKLRVRVRVEAQWHWGVDIWTWLGSPSTFARIYGSSGPFLTQIQIPHQCMHVQCVDQ